MAKAEKLEALTRTIRATFQELRTIGDALHADLEITAAMRAVIEKAAEGEPETVPQIARAKTVSRQHIQMLADSLVEKGLLIFVENPRHKRSPFVALTMAGRRAHAEMRRREAGILDRLAGGFSAAELDSCSATMEALRRDLRAIRKERTIG